MHQYCSSKEDSQPETSKVDEMMRTLAVPKISTQSQFSDVCVTEVFDTSVSFDQLGSAQCFHSSANEKAESFVPFT